MLRGAAEKGADRAKSRHIGPGEPESVFIVDAAERQNRKRRRGGERSKAVSAEFLRIRMTGGRKGGRQNGEIGADFAGDAQFPGIVTGGGQYRNNPLVARKGQQRRPQHSRRQMNALRADAPGQTEISRDNKKDAARPADRRIPPRHGVAPWIVAIAVNDGGASRQRAQDRLRHRTSPAVSEEGERERRVDLPADCFTLAFERKGRRC